MSQQELRDHNVISSTTFTVKTISMKLNYVAVITTHSINFFCSKVNVLLYYTVAGSNPVSHQVNTFTRSVTRRLMISCLYKLMFKSGLNLESIDLIVSKMKVFIHDESTSVG